MHVWLIFCPRCNKNTTVGKKPPKDAEPSFTSCNVCGNIIDSTRGHLRRLKKLTEPVPPLDLLEIE